MIGFQAATHNLLSVLEGENEALQALDLRTANAMLELKRHALADFEASCSTAARPLESDTHLRGLATRLQRAALDNKRLLERAIVAQQHVMTLLSRAVLRVTAQDRYGCNGVALQRQAGTAFAINSSA